MKTQIMQSLARWLVVAAALTLATQLRAEQADVTAFRTIEFPPDAGRSQESIAIRAFEQDFLLDVRDNARLLDALPANQRARIPASDRFLTGSLEHRPGSWIRLSRVAGRWSGGFFDGEELYLVDHSDAFPASRAAASGPGQPILFRFADLRFEFDVDRGGAAASGASPLAGAESYAEFASHLRDIAALQGGPMLSLPTTIVSDVEFTGDHGANVASVVAGRINFVDGIFSSQVGTGIQLLHHEILTDNGPLDTTDSAALLTAFRNFMDDGPGSNLPFVGVAHLFTGKNLNGSTVGRAYLGVLCFTFDGFATGIDQNLNSNTTSSLVFAHELGHNFDAPHDGENECANEPFNGIMNPSINGSQQFSDCSLEQMAPEVAAADCLVETVVLEILFQDSFESG